jgi:hypothetical protein
MSTKVAGEDITVDGSPLKTSPALVQLFENIVANTLILGQIKKSPLGEIILSRIKNGPGDVEIYPRTERDLNAETRYKLKSNGRGRDPKIVIMFFKPEQWADTISSANSTIPTNLRAFEPGMLKDEVLFHELVHAGRLLDGFAQAKHMLAPDTNDVAMYANEESAAYEDIEEFATILVSNIYLSEKGQKVFRASHGGKKFPLILDQAQSTSDGFLAKKSNYDLVKLFCDTDPIAPSLADIKAPFNPVRAFFQNHPEDFFTNRSNQPS